MTIESIGPAASELFVNLISESCDTVDAAC